MIFRWNSIGVVCILFFVLSCGNKTNQDNSAPVSQNKSRPLTTDSLKSYYADPAVPGRYKAILRGHVKEPNDGYNSEEFMMLIPRVRDANNPHRKVDFVVLSRTLPAAQGTYAESLCSFAEGFIREQPATFFSFFDKNDLLSEEDLQKWSDYVIMKLTAKSPEKMHATIQEYNKKIRSQCESSSGDIIDLSEEFAKYLEGYSSE